MPGVLIALMAFLGVFWLLVVAGLVAACMLSSEISQKEERMWAAIKQKKSKQEVSKKEVLMKGEKRNV